MGEVEKKRSMKVQKSQTNRSQVRLWTGARSRRGKAETSVDRAGVVRVGWAGTKAQEWETEWELAGGRHQVLRSEARCALRGEGKPKVEVRDGWMHRSGKSWTRKAWRKRLKGNSKQG